MVINRTALLIVYIENSLSDDEINNIIGNLYNLSEYKLFTNYWTMLNKLIILNYDTLTENCNDGILLKYKIWLKLHGSICTFLQQKSVKDFEPNHNSIYTFLFWPIITGPNEVNIFSNSVRIYKL